MELITVLSLLDLQVMCDLKLPLELCLREGKLALNLLVLFLRISHELVVALNGPGVLVPQQVFHSLGCDETTCGFVLRLDRLKLVTQIIVEEAKRVFFLVGLLLLELRLAFEQVRQILVFSFFISKEVTHATNLLLSLVDFLAEALLLHVRLLNCCLVIFTVALEVLQQFVVGRHIFISAATTMPSAARYVISAQLVQRLELLLDLFEFHVALLVHLTGLFLEDFLDLNLQAAHIVAVILLDNLLELSFLAL